VLKSFLDGRLTVHVGDITTQAVDAIVNAANSTLYGGGGVDGAIHRAGGKAILDACLEIRRTTWPHGLPAGEAVITTAGHLPAKFVVHTVGPIYGETRGRDAALLSSCYRKSLELAVEHAVATIAFPAISTGVYDYPKDEAARVAYDAIATALKKLPTIVEVRLVFFSEEDAEIFLGSLSS
jgi:O-acetyl-ADP-ribose deacetylase (regulator of RNase III)